jgi:hypothetical protein
MLQTKYLSSWLDFEKIIQDDLLDQTQEMRTGPYLYRGHSDAQWHLETTLERYAVPNLHAEAYYNLINSILPEIETFAGRKWTLPLSDAFIKAVSERPVAPRNPAYEYMAYLRHFGFPSPFLDWTFSPYIAAFFAFRDVASNAESVAIWRYLWASEMATFGVSDHATIFPIPVASRDNPRHYLQQSIYTLCLSQADEQVYFASHEDPRQTAEDTGEWIVKYILPATERVVALNALGAYNITAYSLFGSEESLLEALFVRKYLSAHITLRVMGNQNTPQEVWW